MTRAVSTRRKIMSTSEELPDPLASICLRSYTAAMLQPDRLGARVRPWFLIMIASLCFMLYELIQAPFYGMGAYGFSLGILLSTAIGVLMPLLSLTRRLGIPFRAQFQLEWPERGPALAVAGATLSLIPALEIMTAAMARRYPPEASYMEFVEMLRPESLPAFLAVLVALVLAVPLAEELIFRGLLQRVLLRHSGRVLSILLVAVLFGAVHPLYSIPGVTLLGIFFGTLALTMGNLSYSLIAHALWNLVNLIVLRQSSGDLEQMHDSPFQQGSLLWMLVSLALFVFFSRFWWRARV